MWLPTDASAVQRRPAAIAQATGLMRGPCRETLINTLAWCQAEQDPVRVEVGLTAERETSVLAAWRERR